MNRNLYFLFGIIVYFGISTSGLLAQVEYNMSNQTVNDCEGKLLDSDAGDNGQDYDHNENYTFSICIPDAAEITMNFLFFCSEEKFDSLRLFDGPDTLSIQIGESYTGENDPPQVIATSGCLTVNFISDANVACGGWEADWFVEVDDPIPPNIIPIADVPCESNKVIIEFDTPLICDSLYASNFEIRGPQLPSVINATPIDCLGGRAKKVELTLDPFINRSGNYQVIYTYRVYNECGRLFTFKPTNNFAVTNCPLFVTLEPEDDPICAGTCTYLFANATGGDSRTYSYNWDPVATDSAYAYICPTNPTTYFVTVTDAVGATVVGSILITPNPAPIIDRGDLSICQSIDPFILNATPSGGIWSALGIDEDNEETGLYEPDLVTFPTDTVIYIDENECEAQIVISVTPLNDGNDDASCPGADSFFVSGGFPMGGEWSGPHITEEGLFSPEVVGSFEVTYTHPNGCAGTKTINVDSIQMPILDTLCQSEEEFNIQVTPFGGVWSGKGIDDEDEGLFVPEDANPGANLLHYEINGCADSMIINIKEINGGRDLSACPDQSRFILPGSWGPDGGNWTGRGIIDGNTGLYDPSIVPNGENDTLQFVTNGCTDTRIVYIRYTQIRDKDTLFFCLDDDSFLLDKESVDIRPRSGSWMGAGIVKSGEDWFFRPSIAGEGIHKLVYEANTCVDSMFVIVAPRPVVESYEVCVLDGPIILEANPKGQIWSGKGIINREDGVFDPQIAGVGIHRIINKNRGCPGRGEVIVGSDEQASIENIVPNYCFENTNIPIEVSPEGGVIMIDSIEMNSFNPSILGSGEHIVLYSVGIGDCYSEDSISFVIDESFEVVLPTQMDTICFGENYTLNVDISSSSSTKNYTYNWDNGLGFGKTHIVNPLVTTNYTVTVDDGCTEIQKLVTVFVHDPIDVSYTTSEAICFDDTTQVTIQATPGENYTFAWDTNPISFSNTIQTYPTNYNVTVTNNTTTCSVEEIVRIPGYGLLKANFDTSPNVDCISDLDPEIEILDFSVGAIRGYWDFGDGTQLIPYDFGANLNHIFRDTGVYQIKLHLENEGNCISEYELTMCVKKEQRLFAPNAFTPNYDGINDVFQLKGIGISDMNWKIFNRWGLVIYEGSSLEDSWDGKYKGRRVRPGVYTFLVEYKTPERKDEVMKGLVTVIY